MQRRFYHQAGDTIVEVIIAVAIVSTILAGAFIVTNRSTQAVRDSEEHAQALQYLQGQVELLRAAAATPGKLATVIGAYPQGFCFDSTLTAYQANSTSCTGANGAVPYLFMIKCSPSSIACPAGSFQVTTFDLTTTWDAVGGGTDKVYLSYEAEAQ